MDSYLIFIRQDLQDFFFCAFTFRKKVNVHNPLRGKATDYILVTIFFHSISSNVDDAFEFVFL